MAHPKWLEDLLEDLVNRPIDDDPRTRKNAGTFLGWAKDRILEEVLVWGQADFDQPIGALTPDDRALLYARYNLPRHLDELRAAFRQLFGDDGVAGKPTVLDLGCGPFTAGLSVAAALQAKRPFRYFGLDRAASMCRLAERFAFEARTRGGLHAQSTVEFCDDLDAINFGAIRGDLTLVVASYLLASKTLNVAKLVKSIVSACERIGPGPIALLYTNSAKDFPNRNFPKFRDGLVNAGFELLLDNTERFDDTKRPGGLRYALFFRAEKLEVPT